MGAGLEIIWMADKTIVEANTLVSFFEMLHDVTMVGLACLIENLHSDALSLGRR